MFGDDDECLIEAFSPCLLDLGYFYTVPSLGLVYRISPSLYE